MRESKRKSMFRWGKVEVVKKSSRAELEEDKEADSPASESKKVEESQAQQQGYVGGRRGNVY